MFKLINTAPASASTPASGKTTVFVDNTGVISAKNSSGTSVQYLTTTGASTAYQPLDSDLTGIASLTYSADQTSYYNGTAWATYSITAAGRSLSGVAGTANTFPYFSAANVVTLASITATGRAVVAAADAAAARTAIQAVGLVGDETVDGYKTWNSQHTWNLSATGSIIYGQPGGDSTGITMQFGPAGARRRSDIRARASDILIGCSNTSDGSAPARFLSVAHNEIKPNVTNVMSLGLSSNLWTQVWATNSTISPSDARLKTEPRQLREAEFKAASAIARLPAVWRWLNRVNGDENCEPEGRDARKHFGPTVQAVIAVMEANGLDPFEYSFICYDKWEAQEATFDEEGNELTPAREAGDRYSFRKEEMLCFIVRALAQEIDVLTDKVESLDARLALLENK